MKSLKSCIIALTIVGGMADAYAVDTSGPSLAYGIRVYSTVSDYNRLVSFSVDNPGEEEELLDLSEYKIMAATCHDNVYYIIHSDDGIMASKLLKLDMNTMKVSVVKTYDWKKDLAGNMICSDMTYDPSSGLIYLAGYNMQNAELEEGEEVSAPYAIITIDPSTGDATLVGEQNDQAFVSLAVDGEGTLLAVDSSGYLWEISKWAGLPNYDMDYLGVTPVGLQSMAHDFGKNATYWASYTADSNQNGISSLIRFSRNEDWEYEIETVGAVGTDSEIVGLYIDSNPLPKGAPAIAENLTVTPGANGIASASVAWTNPVKTIGGAPLSVIDVNIYRDDVLVNTLSGLEPGKEYFWTDSNVEVGNHIYGVAAANDVSEGRKAYFSELWIGEDLPGAPSVNAVASEDLHSITVSWTAPAAGLHNGWHVASQITYDVVRRPDGKEILSGSSSTSVTDSDILEMHGYRYEVTASTPAGKGGMGISEAAVAGNPHQAPFAADFNDPDQALQWKTFNTDGDEYGWYLNTSAWGGTYDAFFRYNPENILNPETVTDDWLISPPIQLEADRLYIAKYDLRLLGDLFPANSTFAMGKGQNPGAMTEKLSENEAEVNDIVWTMHAVPFTVKESGAYNFGYQTRNAVPAQFYKFAVEEVDAHDMAAGEINGNTLANVGKETKFTVSVTNKGFYDAEGFSIDLIDSEGNLLTSADYDITVASQQSESVEIAWTPEKEGNVKIAAKVVLKDDTAKDNDCSQEFAVTVFGSGEMLHITDGKTGTGYAPFYGSYLHSAVQTIYPSELLGDIHESDISAMVYYIYNAMGKDVGEIEFEVALACVDKKDFTDKAMITEDKFTQVYKGKLQIDPANKTVAIIFDEPFRYTGGNLCVFTRHDSEAIIPVFFQAAYSTEDPLFHSCLYRGDTRFDFTQQPNGSYHDLPNVSFLISGNTGIDEAMSQSPADVRYSRSTGRITVNGEYEVCRIYNMTGMLLDEVTSGDEIIVSAEEGIVIVEVISGSGCIVKKIITGK